MQRTRSTPAIAYETHGERGSRVLLIMGFGMRGAIWQPQVEALSPSHQVVTYDHRGIGESDQPEGVWDMRTMAKDAVRLLDELGWSEAHVVGVSMGGMVAQELALLTPGRVRSLSLVATHGGGFLAFLPPPKGLYWFARANLSGPDGRIFALQHLLYSEAFLAEQGNVQVDSRIRELVSRRANPKTLLAQFCAVATHNTLERLKSLSMPRLIIKPALDLLVRPSHSDKLLAAMPGARFSTYPDAGHGLAYQCADRLNRDLLEFFREVDGPLVKQSDQHLN